MVSKEFFEFISAHCGNVVAWLLILWPFVHLALLIQTFSRTVFNEVLWLIDMGLGGKGQWITAIKITCIKLYLHLLIFSNLSIIYFGIPIGTILFVLVVATFIIHIIDISIEDKTLSEDLPGIIRMVIYFVLFVAIATVYKGNIIKNLIMDCQSYTKYRPNETTGGIFVSWRRKEELPTGA